jgi:hypothetical protein
MIKATLSILATVLAVLAGTSWARPRLVEATGFAPGTVNILVGLALLVTVVFVPMVVAAYSPEGRRATPFTVVVCTLSLALCGGFVAAEPNWQQQVQDTVGLAAAAAPVLLDDGEQTCRKDVVLLLDALDDPSLKKWRATGEVITNESAAPIGMAALGLAHIGSVMVNIFVQALADAEVNPRVYGDAKELAARWKLDDPRSKPSENIQRQGRAFLTDVLTHIEEAHRDDLANLKLLKARMDLEKGNHPPTATPAERAAAYQMEKVGDAWTLRGTEQDQHFRCVREDGHWRLDLVR